MRYWHPFSDEVAAEVSQFAPDQIILLPLYPQCSTTTSHSSVNDWIKAFNAKTASPVQASSAPTSIIGCYPTDEFFISAFVKLALSVIQDAIKYSQDGKKPVLLLSAHGLPESVIKEGDPYQYQIELTAKAIEDNLEQKLGRTFEVHICYQSRVGPKKWIGPASDDLIKAFAQEKRAIIVLPIAFVSDHSETLVELDQDYRELAIENGATFYGRVPSLGTHPDFIQCLVERVQSSLKNTPKPILCKKGMTCLCEKNQKLYLTSEITNEFTSNAA
jgi:ferrochelatase